MIRSFGMQARKRPPGSRKEMSGGAGCRGGRPMPYHQGMPFWAKTMAVSSLKQRLEAGDQSRQRGGLQRSEITMSCGPSWAGSPEAFTLAETSESPTRNLRPLARTGSRCAPRITHETS